MSTLEEKKALVKKIQKTVYGIMCDIDDFCRENNITYYLSGGTCLGAVRHQGFIPWDDDADIMMPRAEYKKFLLSFKKKYADKYYVGSLYTDPEWRRPSARICDIATKFVPANLNDKPMGFFIDIFPIDGLPNTKTGRKLFYKKQRILKGLMNSAVRTEFLPEEKYRAVKNIASLITKKIGARKFAQMLDNDARRYPFKTSEYVGATLAVHYYERETIKKKCMSRAAFLKFEDRMLPVPIGYKKYLSNLYGDYMTIPKGAEENGYTHLDVWEIKFADEKE